MLYAESQVRISCMMSGAPFLTQAMGHCLHIKSASSACGDTIGAKGATERAHWR